MLTRRMFVADMAVALAAVGCSRSDRITDNAPEVPATGVSATPRRGPLLKLLANHHPNLCNVGSRVARERGFFAAEGLDVDLLPVEFTAGHVHSGEWVAGPNGRVQADMIFVEYPALVDLASGKLDYKVVGGEHSGCKQLVVPARSSIRTLADLKGRRIGLPSIGGDRLIWEYLARQGGVASDSIRWIPVDVPLGGSEELEFVTREFEAGRLDSYATSDPVGEILVSNGVAARLASNTWTAPLNGWYCCMIALRRQLLDARPEVAGAVMRAYRQSAAFIEQHPMDAVTLSVEAGYMPRDTPRDLCARLLREYVWTATGRIEDDLERYFQLLIEAGRMPLSASPRELVARVYQGAEA